MRIKKTGGIETTFYFHLNLKKENKCSEKENACKNEVYFMAQIILNYMKLIYFSQIKFHLICVIIHFPTIPN